MDLFLSFPFLSSLAPIPADVAASSLRLLDKERTLVADSGDDPLIAHMSFRRVMFYIAAPLESWRNVARSSATTDWGDFEVEEEVVEDADEDDEDDEDDY